MAGKTKAWFRLFRAVNLPTVPGDVLAGAALACAAFEGGDGSKFRAVAGASAASVLLYMFGLADNDIVGAATDADRPIPQGLISMGAARVARFLCIAGAIGAGLAAALPQTWWSFAFALAVAIVAYNRTKRPLLMGLCRGLNLLLGAASVGACRILPGQFALPAPICCAALLWVIYIAGVTRYSEGEETNPSLKRRVGILIGALVWLQLAATLFPAAATRDFSFAAAQAAMIALLFLFKRLMPNVSAS